MCIDPRHPRVMFHSIIFFVMNSSLTAAKGEHLRPHFSSTSWILRRTTKVSHHEMFKTVYNEIDIPSPSALAQPSVVIVNIYPRALNLIQLIVPFTSSSAHLQLNWIDVNGTTRIFPRKTFNSFIEINHAKSIESLLHTREVGTILVGFLLLWRGKKFRSSFGWQREEKKEKCCQWEGKQIEHLWMRRVDRAACRNRNETANREHVMIWKSLVRELSCKNFFSHHGNSLWTFKFLQIVSVSLLELKKFLFTNFSINLLRAFQSHQQRLSMLNLLATNAIISSIIKFHNFLLFLFKEIPIRSQ